MKEGKAKREDYAYERQGTALVLLAYDMDTGQRYVPVRKQRPKKEDAEFMAWLVKEHYPRVEQIELVQDNLNTHSYGSFYEHLPAEQARSLAKKRHFHFTPKHGCWLNMAQIEFSVLARQCLARRIDAINKLEKQVLQGSKERNEQKATIHWSFTVNTARLKLACQYVKVNESNTTSNF